MIKIVEVRPLRGIMALLYMAKAMAEVNKRACTDATIVFSQARRGFIRDASVICVKENKNV